MPKLRMKSKPSFASSRGHNLHVHCGSSIITKDSRIHNKIRKNVIPDKHVQISPNDECNRLTKVVDCRDSCDGAVTQISDVVLLSSDHKAIDMGVHQENPPFVFETFFSHNFEDDDVDKKVMIETNEGERSEVVDDESSDMPHLVTDDSDESSYSTHELQSCSVSDFIISDLTIPTLSFNDSMGFSDLICSSSPDYDHISSEFTFDMEEGYMMLPFPEEKIDKNAINPHNDDFVLNMDDSYLCFAIHELRSPDQQTGISFQPSGFEELEYFDSHLFLKMPEAETVSPLCPFKSQKETQNKRVTLVLDLDETLVHSTLNYCKDADFSFVVFFNMKENTVYVRKRPYLHAFLERVSQMFEIIVFTASQSVYAEKLLDILDPDKKFTYNRVFRDSCIMSEGTYTKDLTVLGIDLAKVAIVDNSPQVFRLQVNNGIPIKSWFDDPSDNALPSLLPFLETLVDAEDVRPIIAKKFSNKEK